MLKIVTVKLCDFDLGSFVPNLREVIKIAFSFENILTLFIPVSSILLLLCGYLLMTVPSLLWGQGQGQGGRGAGRNLGLGRKCLDLGNPIGSRRLRRSGGAGGQGGSLSLKGILGCLGLSRRSLTRIIILGINCSKIALRVGFSWKNFPLEAGYQESAIFQPYY